MTWKCIISSDFDLFFSFCIRILLLLTMCVIYITLMYLLGNLLFIFSYYKKCSVYVLVLVSSYCSAVGIEDMHTSKSVLWTLKAFSYVHEIYLNCTVFYYGHVTFLILVYRDLNIFFLFMFDMCRCWRNILSDFLTGLFEYRMWCSDGSTSCVCGAMLRGIDVQLAHVREFEDAEKLQHRNISLFIQFPESVLST